MTFRHPRPFYFLRHGQTDWNVEGRLQGHTDIPLNATGVEQARLAAEVLKRHPITRIISSPLVRALKTAAIAAEGIRLPVHVDSNLMERPFGSLEGRLREEILAAHNLPTNASVSPLLPGDAEHWPQTVARARASIGHWLDSFPEDTLLFVSHGAFFRALHEALTGTHEEAENATPYLYTPTPAGAWQLNRVRPGA